MYAESRKCRPDFCHRRHWRWRNRFDRTNSDRSLSVNNDPCAIEISVNRVSREIVLQEYGKFSALFRSTVYSDYRSALQLSSSIDGVSNCYMFLSNNEYKTSTRRVAADLDILLRSRRQIAYLLSRVADRAKLEKIEKSLGTLKRDLTLNLARKINF